MQKRPKRAHLAEAMDAYMALLDGGSALEAAAGLGVIVGSDEDFEGPSTSPFFASDSS